jgi:hypothetical protein
MTQTALESTIPQSDVDPYRDDILLDPYATYQTLRNAGPLVWLNRLNMYAASRYSVVKEILATPSVFISGKGVLMNERINMALQSIGLCSDGPGARQNSSHRDEASNAARTPPATRRQPIVSAAFDLACACIEADCNPSPYETCR